MNVIEVSKKKSRVKRREEKEIFYLSIFHPHI
jgi:hypothetical protein